MARNQLGDVYTYCVWRVERDDGTWSAVREFLRVDKSGLMYEWVKHKAHANKFTLGEAFAIVQVMEGKPNEEGTLGHDYHFEPSSAG